MPGFNQRGPMNEGPMTGGGRGICTGSVSRGGWAGAGGFQGYGPGMGRRQGRRGCWGGGRGFGMAGGQQPAYPVSDRESLKTRARFLEDELAAIKEELNKFSEE